jgi:exosortase
VLLVIGVVFITPWFAAVGALLALLATGLALGGWKLVRSALPGWAFLWLVIPPPRRYDFVLIAKLQNLVSHWGSQALDLLGVNHVMDGNVVRLAGRELFIDQACSGVYSLFTLLIGTLFYVLWVRTSVVRAVVLAAAAVVWVLFGNVMRIVVVTVLSARFGIDAATGWKHEALGMLMFAVMLGLVLSTDELVTFVGSVLRRVRGRLAGEHLRPAARQDVAAKRRELDLWSNGGRKRTPPTREASATAIDSPPPAPVEASAPLEKTRLVKLSGTWLGSWAVAAAFGVLVPPQLMMPGVRWKEVLLSGDVYEKLFAPLGAESMPARVGAYQRVDFKTDRRDWDNSWGEFSRMWLYRGPARIASLSLDYHFIDWHELTICYKGRGWEMISRRSEPAPRLAEAGGTAKSAPGGGDVIVAEFTNAEGRYGFLVYGMYDRKGRPLDPPESKTTAKLLGERLQSWLRTGDAGGRDGELLSFQLQLFLEGEGSPAVVDLAFATELFGQARARIEQQALATTGVTR